MSIGVKQREEEPVSYVRPGAAVIAENLVRVGKCRVIYRMSIEPRPQFRRRGEDRDFYTVSVEREKNGEWKSAELRDMTSDREMAEKFFRLISKNGVLPEHLSELYEDFFA